MRGERFDRALRKDGAEAERHVGGVKHLEGGDLERFGQALSAEFGIGRQCVPAALGEGLVGSGKARRRKDAAVLEARPLLIAGPVQGRQYIAREASGSVEDGRFGVGVVTRKERAQTARACNMLKRKGEVAQRRGVGHGITRGKRRSSGFCCARSDDSLSLPLLGGQHGRA